MARIFISHSSANNAEAVALRDWLAGEGWDDVFLDLDPERSIVAGERLQARPVSPVSAARSGRTMGKGKKCQSSRRKRELEEAQKLAEAQKKVAQRTRIGAIVATILAVGSLGAAWFGFHQAQLAQQQSAVAEQSTKEAQQNLRTARENFSSALTALAFTEMERRPVDAAKLALAAWPRPGAMDLPKRDVTANAVSRSLAGSGCALPQMLLSSPSPSAPMARAC